MVKRAQHKQAAGRTKPAKPQPLARKSTSPKRAASSAVDLKNDEVIGWAIFTRNGGEIIEQVSERNIEIAVGPSETRPQLRVRFAPDDACDLADEERFLFSAAKQQLPQIRALVMCGAMFSIRTDIHEVVVDRHPDCPHDLVDTCLERMLSERQEAWDTKHDRLARKTYRLVKQLVENVEERTCRDLADQMELRSKLTDVLEQALKGQITEQERAIILRLGPGAPLSPDDFVRSLTVLVKRLDWNSISPDQRLWLSSVGLDQGGMELIRKRFRPGESDLDKS